MSKNDKELKEWLKSIETKYEIDIVNDPNWDIIEGSPADIKIKK